MKAELLYLQNSLVIDNFNFYADEEVRGNPYNTTFNLHIISGCFSGIADCEYDIKKFRSFILELEELYSFKRKIVELNDICYGSKVNFSLDKTGKLEISGEIFGDGMQHSLTFIFEADQSVLPPFIKSLSELFQSSETENR